MCNILIWKVELPFSSFRLGNHIAIFIQVISILIWPLFHQTNIGMETREGKMGIAPAFI
ncbi:hypothetical protein D3C86_1941650 [compost metagenome]